MGFITFRLICNSLQNTNNEKNNHFGPRNSFCCGFL